MNINNQVESQPDVEFPESAIEIYDHNRVSEHPESKVLLLILPNLAAGGFVNDQTNDKVPLELVRFAHEPLPIYYYSRLFLSRSTRNFPTAQDDFMPISIALK